MKRTVQRAPSTAEFDFQMDSCNKHLRLAGTLTLREGGTSDLPGLGKIGLLLDWASRPREEGRSAERVCCMRALRGESNVSVARCVSCVVRGEFLMIDIPPMPKDAHK